MLFPPRIQSAKSQTETVILPFLGEIKNAKAMAGDDGREFSATLVDYFDIDGR